MPPTSPYTALFSASDNADELQGSNWTTSDGHWVMHAELMVPNYAQGQLGLDAQGKPFDEVDFVGDELFGNGGNDMWRAIQGATTNCKIASIGT